MERARGVIEDRNEQPRNTRGDQIVTRRAVRGSPLACFVVHGGLIEGMGNVAILLWADVRFGAHRRAAHRAARTTRGNNRRGVGAELARLLAADSTAEGWGVIVLVGVFVDVVGDDHQAVAALVVAELHPPGAKLPAGIAVELPWDRGRFELEILVRQVFEELLKRDTECLELLLFHPDDRRFAVDDDHQPKPSLAWLADRFGAQTLGLSTGWGVVEWMLGHLPTPIGERQPTPTTVTRSGRIDRAKHSTVDFAGSTESSSIAVHPRFVVCEVSANNADTARRTAIGPATRRDRSGAIIHRPP